MGVQLIPFGFAGWFVLVVGAWLLAAGCVVVALCVVGCWLLVVALFPVG